MPLLYPMIEIRQFIEHITPIDDADWLYFSARLKEKKLSKHHLLIEAGQVEDQITFVTKGIIRLYIPRDENDITFGFVFERDFVSAFDSFLTQTPSKYCIETLSECNIFQISYADIVAIEKNTKVGNIIARSMIEKMFLIKSKRELDLLSKTAGERYMDLFSNRPYLVKNVSLKYIASYIGVTPQALSRIRKRIS